MKAAHRHSGLKHLLDRAFAAALLVVLWPLFIAVAIAIKLDDGGDIFFRQQRAGLGGRNFRIWKFRTMVPNAAQLGGGFFPEGMDLITRVGRILRRTSIDELPQLFNILAGEMSFVGPRPTLGEQVERYTQDQRRRLSVKPGVTGWAQLHGRSEIPWSVRIAYDLEYVERASFTFDIWILIRTFPVVLFGTGNRVALSAEDGTDDLTPRERAAHVETTADGELASTESASADGQARTSTGAFSAGAR